MKRETLAYSADGLRMKGELSFEVGAAPRPGILVFPEAHGFNKHALSRAERLVSLGYVALAGAHGCRCRHCLQRRLQNDHASRLSRAASMKEVS
jgi:hypothetical protein